MPLSGLYSQKREFPYAISKRDIWIGTASIATYATSNHLSNKKDHDVTVSEISALDRNSINRLDRNATYFWNESADEVSDVIAETLPLIPFAVALPQLKNRKWKQAATVGAMYLEVALLTRGFTGITKSIVDRNRPYLYNTTYTPQERFDHQGNGGSKGNASFFSGHSSSTFAAAVFLSKTYTDIYGKGTWSTIIWCSSLSLASVTAYCRVAAGEHFPTDVFVGAVVGSSIGFLIPELHKKKMENLEISMTPGYFRLCYKF